MRTLGVLLLGSVALGSPPGACADDNCVVSEPRQATVDAAGATLLRVEAKAGSLEITGEEGLAEVRARGKACAENQQALERVLLRADRSGDEVRVVVDIPDGWGNGGTLDLELRIPADLAVDVKDGSGGIDVKGVAALSLHDGSGEIAIKGVRGELTIHDGSGEINATDVGGDVKIHDGSGEIELRDVEGSVSLEDGSGQIEVEDVRGGVTVERDGSGGIEIVAVGKGVLIGKDGTGSIRVEDVGGDFTVEEGGSGGIEHVGVKGRVSVPEE